MEQELLMRMMTVEILGLDVYIGVVAGAIGLGMLALVVVATLVDSKK
jgi:phytoene/squalene synthetase